MRIFNLILALSLAGCGGGASSATTSGGIEDCSGEAILGTWQDLPGPSDILTFNSDCSGRRGACAQDFTYTRPSGTVGTTSVTFQSNNGAGGCLAAGTYSCSYNYNATNLAIDCGFGILSYTR